MSLRDEMKRLWTESFDDSPEYVDMFFSRAYRDCDVLCKRRETDDELLSALLLQPYKMTFHGIEVGADYICGAATYRNHRGKGYMASLLIDALKESRNRGSMLTMLIPGETHLFEYYASKGFSEVFFASEQRFTAVHPFNLKNEFSLYENIYDDAVYNKFRKWETERAGSVLHTRRDFLNILDDNRMDNGNVVVMADDDGHPVSIAFAVERDGVAVVTELLGESTDARNAAMRQLRGEYGDLPFKLLAPAAARPEFLTPRGMARITNPSVALEAIANKYPNLKYRCRITDTLLPENSHIYMIDKGEASIDDGFTGHLDLDLTAEVFTCAVFSSPQIGKLLGLPSERPHLSLMLD